MTGIDPEGSNAYSPRRPPVVPDEPCSVTGCPFSAVREVEVPAGFRFRYCELHAKAIEPDPDACDPGCKTCAAIDGPPVVPDEPPPLCECGGYAVADGRCRRCAPVAPDEPQPLDRNGVWAAARSLNATMEQTAMERAEACVRAYLDTVAAPPVVPDEPPVESSFLDGDTGAGVDSPVPAAPVVPVDDEPRNPPLPPHGRWVTTVWPSGENVEVVAAVDYDAAFAAGRAAAEDYDRLRETVDALDESCMRLGSERDEARESAAQLATALREIEALTGPMTPWSDVGMRATDIAAAALAVFDAKEKA